MQIIEMYEPDEDLKQKGNKSRKKFSLLKAIRIYATFKVLRFLVKGIFKCLGTP